MIDIRCHLLDKSEHSPEGFSEPLEMCRLAAEDGVRTVVATPFWEAHRQEPPVSFVEYARRLKTLQNEMRDSLTLKLGFVLQFSANLPLLVERYGARLAICGGRHLLISLPSFYVPAEMEEVWRALRGRGYSIIVARPECTPTLRRNPDQLRRWASEGMVFQLDAQSVTGAHGREAQSFALRCVRDFGDSIVVASNGRDGVRRRPVLSHARDFLSKRFGALCAGSAVDDMPDRIINPSFPKTVAATTVRPPQGWLGNLSFGSLWR